MAYGTPVDYIIIVIYMVGILAFGSLFSRYSRTTKDFFTSGQRFSWWLIALSCISLVVGSYSFVKYSEMGFTYGLSSSMSYLNDWFLAPLFILGWLPIIYYARVTSIPEYFEKRFDKPTRIMAILFIMLYLIGYIGINLFTMGRALSPIIPWFSVLQWAVIIAIITSLYCAFGGQTAVIMTDLIQGIMLLVGGFLLLVLGIIYLGRHTPEDVSALAAFWNGLPPEARLPFSGFVQPEKFPMVGVFWQDFFGSSMFFYFANQGLIMRFLSLKSVNEGRKTIIAVVLILMPLAAVSVASAGWVGRALLSYHLLPADSKASDIFVIVTELVTRPGLFGFILSALIAALMSTIDSLINAVAAIGVNDIYKPFIAPNRSDKHYLNIARLLSLVFTFFGLALVPLYMSFEYIYQAHAAFTAAISPPLIVVVIFGILWKRFSARAAFVTLVSGALIMALSLIWPKLINPFITIHGMTPGKDAYVFMRALYGMLLCAAVAAGATFIWPNRDVKKIEGLWIGTLQAAKRFFKGREPNDREPGAKVQLVLVPAKEEEIDAKGMIETVLVTVGREDAERMKAQEGDLVYVSDRRWWLGGLHSLHATLRISDAARGEIIVPEAALRSARLTPGEIIIVEKII